MHPQKRNYSNLHESVPTALMVRIIDDYEGGRVTLGKYEG